MAPGLALESILNLPFRATVLDPMVGSGTVLAIARAHGHRAIGFDVDPLAVLISRVWTRSIDAGAVRHEATRVLTEARRVAGDLARRDAYPMGADSETRAFVRYWFDGYARSQLTALALVIADVPNETVREVLWCAFSRLVIAKQAGVSLALDLSHSRPHRRFDRAPRKPFHGFQGSVDRVIEGCVHRTARGRGPTASVGLGDIRDLPLGESSVDLVFTSPPYLNAIDYLRCSKFSLVWMGHSIDSLRAIRSSAIGTEVGTQAGAMSDAVLNDLGLRPPLSSRMKGIVRRYINDTSASLREVARVLKQRGKAVYVVGENTIRGTFIPTGELVAHVANQAGLDLVTRSVRNLPGNRRYLPPPGSAGTQFDTRMRREVILTFHKRRVQG